MKNFDKLFRNRIGIGQKEPIAFDTLDRILQQFAQSIPFENLYVLSRQFNQINQTSVYNKILVQNKGGLCYELNPLLYYFLLKHGLDVSMVRGTVYDHQAQKWSTPGRTHVTLLVTHYEQRYLLDTGFGGNLPLTPVPLDRTKVASQNGKFQVEPFRSIHGDHVLKLKLKHKDKDWRIGYAFDSSHPIQDTTELDEIQRIVIDHPESPFNKHSLITKITPHGNITLTDRSFTEWNDGNVSKEPIDEKRFKTLAKLHFGIHLNHL